MAEQGTHKPLVPSSNLSVATAFYPHPPGGGFFVGSLLQESGTAIGDASSSSAMMLVALRFARRLVVVLAEEELAKWAQRPTEWPIGNGTSGAVQMAVRSGRWLPWTENSDCSPTSGPVRA
jgi:hypothetical protein